MILTSRHIRGDLALTEATRERRLRKALHVVVVVVVVVVVNKHNRNNAIAIALRRLASLTDSRSVDLDRY